MTFRWKNTFLGLSLFFCLLAMVAWGFGIAWKGFYCVSPRIGNFAFGAVGVRGALGLGVDEEDPWIKGIRTFDLRVYSSDELPRSIFVALSIDPPDAGLGKSEHVLVLPYWLLILLFGMWPVMRWRARYVEQRDKAFLEQAAKEKQ